MKDCLILIGSMTKALQAQKILEQHGVKSDIRKTINSKDGCGYCVFAPNNTKNAILVLQKNNIKIKGRFPLEGFS
ncbi:MAG: DUF3343 domain-containing protein [Oscillospiraceae bacterium]|jgi:hypothetical protein|nr:DUF3343 domain-containing protein [Oscillospiraceae bacterium]